jgi:hypothetical protein
LPASTSASSRRRAGRSIDPPEYPPSYRSDALGLQNLVVESLGSDVALRSQGMLIDLPDAVDLDEYTSRLSELEVDPKTLPVGRPGASRFEEIIGEMLKLCFFRSLTNVEAKVRDVAGTSIRDWVASNAALSGFWEMVRQRYRATQVVGLQELRGLGF